MYNNSEMVCSHAIFSFGIDFPYLPFFVSLSKCPKNEKFIQNHLSNSDVETENGHLVYTIRQKDNWQNQMVPSVEAFQKWPDMVLQYLESRINIQRSDTANVGAVGAVVEIASLQQGVPISIECRLFIFILFLRFTFTYFFQAFSNIFFSLKFYCHASPHRRY